jgi:flagellar hook-associated protein 2
MSTSIGPTYDPTSTATALAQKYTSSLQEILTAQTQQANAVDKGLADLESALLAYQGSLESLTGLNKTMLAIGAGFSDTSVGSASASASAMPGTYNFFVEQIATASQVSYGGLADSTASGGTLGIQLGGSTAFTVNLATADADANGTLTTRELAAAINGNAANTSLVSAAVVTVNGVDQMILSAKNTGASSAVTLDTSAVADATLKGALSNAANIQQMVVAKDAIAWLGAQTTGTKIQQASNTFTNIAGVKMTFTHAQASGAAPVTLTVGNDSGATTANVQAFVDAYNKLKSAIDAMVDAGDPSKGQAGGVFSGDGAVRVLREHLVSLMRPAGSTSLAAYGIIAARDGTLSLKADRLTRQLAADPTGLDTLIGSASTSAPSGIAGSLDTFLKGWSDMSGGQVKKRQDVNGNLHKALADRQAQLDGQYNAAYQRYLLQFTQLQALQSQMASNSSMFDALFGNNKSN